MVEKDEYMKYAPSSFPSLTYRSSAAPVKPVFHLAKLFARTEKNVGTIPTCSRRLFSPTNFDQSRC